MKRIFPMYKGVSLDKAGMGYSSVQSAKHYMEDYAGTIVSFDTLERAEQFIKDEIWSLFKSSFVSFSVYAPPKTGLYMTF